jgi:hypothetical protein
MLLFLWLAACDREEETCLGEEEFVASLASSHVSGGVDYDDLPPTGGPHDPCWAEWGVHEEEVPDERWVHNLEHGGVVFLHNCPNGCPDAVDRMEKLVTGQAILTPYAALPSRFAVVSWEHRLLMDCADTDAMQAFYDTHFDQAPESSTSAPGESCM